MTAPREPHDAPAPDFDLSVYCVTDDRLPFMRVIETVEAAVAGGATMVQLRDKSADLGLITIRALALLERLKIAGVPLIINDHAQVAFDAGAQGVHLGTGDGDPVAARALLGNAAIIGVSVGSVEELARVPDGIVDYVGIGPVFATATKGDAGEALGLEGLQALADASALPCVAIGGIDVARADAVFATGVDGIAVVAALSHADDPYAVALQLCRSAAGARQGQPDEERG